MAIRTADFQPIEIFVRHGVDDANYPIRRDQFCSRLQTVLLENRTAIKPGADYFCFIFRYFKSPIFAFVFSTCLPEIYGIWHDMSFTVSTNSIFDIQEVVYQSSVRMCFTLCAKADYHRINQLNYTMLSTYVM